MYGTADAEDWDYYVHQHPKGSVFHEQRWKILVERAFGHTAHYLIAESSNGTGDQNQPPGKRKKIVGLLPLFSLKSLLFGKSMVSVPFAAYGGILADDEAAEEALYQEALRLTSVQRLDYLELRNEQKTELDLPVKDLYYVFKKEISNDNDENLKAIPRKQRAMVRKAMKKGLTFRLGGLELLDEFYQMFAFNYRRLGTPVFSKSFLKKILEVYGDDSSVLIIYKGAEPLSGVISFYFKNQVIPYYSGAYPAANRYAANDYLYWILMSDAAEKGYRIFDFGRSKIDTGPFHFKKHWGFDPEPLYYQFYLHRLAELPNISPANPKYRRKIETWKKLPLWATKFIGPRIVKYIP